MPAAGMEHGINRIITVPAGVTVIPAGRGMIAPVAQMPFIVTVMEYGINRIITVPAGVPVIPAGAAAIVPKSRRKGDAVASTDFGVVLGVPVMLVGAETIVRLKTLVAGMEHGFNRIITEPAGVPVDPAGAGIIVPSSNNGVHSDDEQRAGQWSRPSGVWMFRDDSLRSG